MAEERQAKKLKERLQRWQSYAAEPAATDPTRSQEAQEANGLCLTTRESGDVTPFALLADTLPQILSAPHGNGASHAYGGERYEDQIAHLEAELERERAHAQELAVKWGSEVVRRQRESHHQKPPPQPKVRTLAIEEPKSSEVSKPSLKHTNVAPKLQQAQKSVHNYGPILVICLSVFLAGIGSVIALNLVWSLVH